MSAHTAPRRTFVGSADAAPGGASIELVPQSPSDAISHPAPTPDDPRRLDKYICIHCNLARPLPNALLCRECTERNAIRRAARGTT